MPRQDISVQLVHFTSGATHEEAFARFLSIVNDRVLLGNAGFNRGAHRCVCFSEAPLASLPNGLVNPDAYSRYSPFGVMLSKAHVFARGGRPVIYQSEAEYNGLPNEMQWRHMRYEPDANPPVDFCLERELRIRTDAFDFNPQTATLVVPDRSWSERLELEHEAENDWAVYQYTQAVGRELAELAREPFQWRVLCLN